MRILLAFIFMIPSAYAYKIGGLKQRVILRHMGYTHTPHKRDKFNSFGSYFKYRSKQKGKIRQRLNKKLSALRAELIKIKQENAGIIGEFDPSLKVHAITKDNVSVLDSMELPGNITYRLPPTDHFKDIEVLSFTVTQKPNPELMPQLFERIETIFKTKYPDLRKKKRFKNKKEQELYESLKVKSYQYYQYEPYFAIYLGADYLVDSEYLRDLSGVLNSRYIKIFRAFKTRYFSSSSDIRNLVNSKVILDVQSVIENNNYKTLEEPFLIPKSKIPRGVVRLEDKINDIDIYLLIAVNAESMNPKNKKLISTFLTKSIQ